MRRLNTAIFSDGSVAPASYRPESCPNHCGPLLPLTWMRETMDLRELIQQQDEEIQRLKAMTHG
jgi:hypothetical protein